MTIFSGAISLRPNDHLPEPLIAGLRASISRHGADQATEASGQGFFVTKVDIGAFGAPGLERGGDGSVTIVAGEPLMRDGEGDLTWNRMRDVALLHTQLASGDLDGLRGCRGTFCGLHFNARTRSLSLFVDKMGVRPVYLWVGPHFAVFSTALRVLEALPEVHRQFDVRGVTEIASFGFALSDRTPYVGVNMLKAGELAHIAGGACVREPYWRWDGPLDTATPHAQTVDNAYSQFIKAISRRHRNLSVAAAFLSGGLDSRVIVGGLHATGADVFTVNYAPDGSQDQVFAALVASRLGIHYTQIETTTSNVAQGYRKDEVNKWLARTFAAESVKSPLVWSGDGGSVALGHVYMTQEIASAMQDGKLDQAMGLFTTGIAPAIFKRSMRRQLSEVPFQGIREEVQAIDSADGGRRFHLFLMLNDQRRHLARHFEDLDVERIEFQLPFFDGDFLESVLRLPNEPLMYHKFYMDWLARFPNQLDTIPWQAYPGHVPCTLPSAPGLKYQWDEYYDKKMYQEMRREITNRGLHMLTDAQMPWHIVSRPVLARAVALTRLNLRNHGYLIRTASIFQQYWNASS